MERSLRLSDLASDGVDVQLHCNDCGNRTVASAHHLAGKFGPGSVLQDLLGYLECPLCGSLAVDATPDTWARHQQG